MEYINFKYIYKYGKDICKKYNLFYLKKEVTFFYFNYTVLHL